jgi:hypothetical protein
MLRSRPDLHGQSTCFKAPDGTSSDLSFVKAATNRVKDRESLPRLRAFRGYWMAQRQR